MFREIEAPLEVELEGGGEQSYRTNVPGGAAAEYWNAPMDPDEGVVGGGGLPHPVEGDFGFGGDVKMGSNGAAGAALELGQLEFQQHHDEAATAALELGQLEVKLYPLGTPVGEEHWYDDLRTHHSKIITEAIRQFRHYASEILEGIDGSEQICLHLGNRMRCFFITQQTKISRKATVLTDKHVAKPTAWYVPVGRPLDPEIGPMPYESAQGEGASATPFMFLPCTLLVFVEPGPERCAARLFPGAVAHKREAEWKDATSLDTIRTRLGVSNNADMHYCVLALKESKAPKAGCGPTPSGGAPMGAKDIITDLYIDILG